MDQTNWKDISPATLRKDLNIATGTMTKLRKNEEVALSVLLRICEYLDCNIGDICDAIPDTDRYTDWFVLPIIKNGFSSDKAVN